MLRPLLLSLVVAAAATAARAAELNAGVEARIQKLLDSMTLEEKLGQLQQLGQDQPPGQLPATSDAGPGWSELAAKGRLGSTLFVRGAKNVNALQRAAVEKSRLKIPVLFGFDMIHGYRTVFPIPLAMASSWDPDVVEKASRFAAREAALDGVRWTFSPMVDIARDPRWGRVAEGSGEDPFLGAAMARAYVRGYQGMDPSAPDSLAATAKHWVGYGAVQGGRDYAATDISERALREIYFPPFKAAVDAGVLTFMSAFNDLDGVPASGNRFTLTDVLRGEWGFNGFVVSDLDSVAQLIPDGVAADDAEAARKGLTAGVDMEMHSGVYGAQLPKLIESGKVPQSAVDEAVRRVLRVKIALGLFEHPYADEAKAAAAPDAAARAAARAAGVRSLVLLKNEGGLLPLSKDVKKLAVIGPVADDALAVLGSWTGDGRPAEAVTVLAGLRAALPDAEISYAKGCSVSVDTVAAIADAVDAASRADAVVLALGESGDMSGENASRAFLGLPGRQLELAKAVLAAGKPTAVVLLNGRPLAIPELAERAPAILEAWQPGTEAGDAIADVLFGDAGPGGKLPMTFPRSVGQIPLFYDHRKEGQYIDEPATPLFPFGWGLSYADVRLTKLAVFPARIEPGEKADVTVFVENQGKRAGDEVVELYIRRRAASVTRPVAELKGFQRVSLKPGEKRRLDFNLGPNKLGFYGLDMKFGVEPGDYEITVGTSSVGGLTAKLTVAK